MTLGERRVGLNFNPSKTGTVDVLKEKAAELIDLIEQIPDGSNANPQCLRWKAIAQTEIETGAMYAVKAATAGQEPEAE